MTKFGADWCVFVDAGVYAKSNMTLSLIQGPITVRILVQKDK